MSISHIQSKSNSGTGNIVDVTMDVAPTDGNFLIAMVSANGGRAMTAQAGWTKLTEVISGSTGGLYRKTAGAGESTTQNPVDTDGGVSDVWTITISEYSGVNTSSPVDAETGNSDADEVKTTTGACNPTDSVERLVIGGAFDNHNGSWSLQKVKGSLGDVNVRGDVGTGGGGTSTCATLFDRRVYTVSGNYTTEAKVSGSAVNGAAFIAIIKPSFTTAVDRRYGAGNKYGNGRLYGPSDIPVTVDRFRWGVDIGWDTTYGESNEADYMTGLSVFRGRRNYLNPNGQGFAPIETGRARITLDNSSGRYDAWNTSSALYPNVTPGKSVRIRLRDLTDTTTYNVFTGIILDIQTIGYGSNAKVVLECQDYWYYLRNQTVQYKNDTLLGYSIDFIIEKFILNGDLHPIFSNFIWPYGFNIETSADTIPYWWSSNSVNMADMLLDLSQAYFGKFFIAADGRATYYDRSSTRTAVQAVTQSILLKDIGNAQPWENQRNVIKIKVRTRKEAAGASGIWELSEPVEVLKGETLEFDAVFTYNGNVVPTRLIAAPAGINYNMNTQEDGLGTDLTNDFIFTFLPFGDVVSMRFVNNSSSDGWITDFSWTGNAIYESGSADVFYPPNIPPQSREIIIDSIWHQGYRKAFILARTYGPQLAAIRQFPVITFDTRPEGLVPDLFDIETVSITALGISSTDFEVGGIEIETTNETCQSFIIRHYLEPHFTA